MHQKNNKENERSKDSILSPKPDPETLHTPDPQEKMEGPVSSPMHGIGEAFDTNESQKDAEDEREKNM
jgi:hypothetical protein